MEGNTWSDLKRLFHGAIELQTEERADYLRIACRGDVELWQEAEELIDAHERAGDFIAVPALVTTVPELVRAAGQLCEKPAATVGQRIGRYEVLRELGRAKRTGLSSSRQEESVPPSGCAPSLPAAMLDSKHARNRELASADSSGKCDKVWTARIPPHQCASQKSYTTS